MRAILCAILLCAACGPDDSPPQSLEWSVLQEDMDGAILSIWGPSVDAIWAVGGTLVTGGGEPLVLRHDERGWWRMELDTPTLWWVHGFGADDVFFVGEAGTIAHFDGASFATMQTGEGYTLFGVWGATPDDLWAVGGPVDGSGPGVILHHDGATWAPVEGLDLEGELLFKVWGNAADDVYVVGHGGTILHWDGAAWARMESGTTRRLLTVRGREPGDIWAVGGLAQSALLHLEDGAWRSLSAEYDEPLMGVWTAPGEPVVVSGFRGLVRVGDVDRPFVTQEPATFEDLHVVWGDGEGSYLAGGGNLVSSGPGRGVIIGHGEVGAGDIQPWAGD